MRRSLQPGDAQQAPQPKKMSGCAIALMVGGVISGIICLCSGVTVALALLSESGQEWVSLMRVSTRSIAEGGNAPGTNELRAAGCTWASVEDMRATLAFHKFFNDGGPLPAENDYFAVGCAAPAGSTKLPTCEAVAAIYAKAVPSERQFVVSVGRPGGERECWKRFTGDGEFIRDVER